MQWMHRTTLAIVMLGIARAAAAQQPAACEFERCGLVVVSPMAVLAAPIDSGAPRSITWYFVPHIFELEGATGQALEDYRAAQRLSRAAVVPSAVGIPAILGIVLYASSDPEDRPWGWKTEASLFGLAVGAELVGGPIRARATERLSRAAWLYSRPATQPSRPADGCSYDRCALRYRYRYWSTRLIQGLDGRPVTSPGELFAQAGDSARAHYERHVQLRRGSRLRDALVLAGVLGGIGGLHSRDETARGVGIGLLVLGYAVGHMSLVSELRERAELETAIWLYNSDLAAGR